MSELAQVLKLIIFIFCALVGIKLLLTALIVYTVMVSIDMAASRSNITFIRKSTRN